MGKKDALPDETKARGSDEKRWIRLEGLIKRSFKRPEGMQRRRRWKGSEEKEVEKDVRPDQKELKGAEGSDEKVVTNAGGSDEKEVDKAGVYDQNERDSSSGPDEMEVQKYQKYVQ